jgi:hypothetical protein
MKRFEYEVTKHPAETFTRLAYFCSENGECKYDQLPDDQLNVLTDLLNERGSLGWELVQVFFGKDGLVAFWKKSI